MKIPTKLKHKPVIVSPEYDKIDGRIEKSDAKGLSIGLAQWNDRGKVDVSAKIWRYTGEKWSRQSEEMPLHRIIDLAILICRTKQHFKDAYKYEKLYDEENTMLDRIPIQGGAMNVEICTDNEMIDEDIKLVNDVLAKDDEMLSERLARLAGILREMGY
ncbi:hypothetical protein SAMN02745751_01138 [Dethiosulfatibacter aminovorans DSM 17477]|uniref:Uncharacterized protein n=1 Tax=Dethiosulfatibacter aminovorans DSM 17477 TaxID=1121476 RepID=A0A1M6EB62_9FIRM|nr:DUF6530 family protein [Dethiosulfatibacter aminovorans]SHI82736.1 hypothetical protein SAMN02745751_01138 [Dethiosulfatibacter aminovorans DSM 17477]